MALQTRIVFKEGSVNEIKRRGKVKIYSYLSRRVGSGGKPGTVSNTNLDTYRLYH